MLVMERKYGDIYMIAVQQLIILLLFSRWLTGRAKLAFMMLILGSFLLYESCLTKIPIFPKNPIGRNSIQRRLQTI